MINIISNSIDEILNDNLIKYKYIFISTGLDNNSIQLLFHDNFKKFANMKGYLCETSDFNFEWVGGEFIRLGGRIISFDWVEGYRNIYYNTKEEVLEDFSRYQISDNDIDVLKNYVGTFKDIFIHLFKLKKFYRDVYYLNPDHYLLTNQPKTPVNLTIHKTNFIIIN